MNTVAHQFLNANLPLNYWGVTSAPTIAEGTCANINNNLSAGNGGCILWQPPDSREIFVTVTASVTVPLLFARTIKDASGHFSTTSAVGAAGQAARRWVRLVLVLDRSNSMNLPCSPTCPIDALKDAVSNSDPRYGFVVNFDESRDQMGLVIFGGSALVAYPPRNYNLPDSGTGPDQHFKTGTPNIVDQVGSYLAAGSATGMAEALILAYKELTKTPQPLYYNVIVLFTDGMPSSFTASYNGNPAVSLYPGDTASTGSANVVKNAGCANWNTPLNPIIGWMTQTASFGNVNNAIGIFPLMKNSPYPPGSVPLASPTPTQLATDVNGWLSNPDRDYLDSYGHYWPVQTNSQGCQFRADPTWTSLSNADLSSFPTEDLYGNKTNTIDYRNSLLYHNANVNLNMNSVNNAYQIGLASWNTTFNAGKRIRGDTNLLPTIYCIGYHGKEDVDKALLKRLANTNKDFADWAHDAYGQYLSSDYDPNSTTGMYYDAGPGSIGYAFQQVQSELLRLSH
jgi:hypothetical protein